MRTLRAILDEVRTILAGIKWHESRPPSLESLLSAITFHSVAVSKDPANASLVSKAFLQRDLGLTLALRRTVIKDTKQDETRDDLSPSLSTLIDSLGFEADAYEWPYSPNFSAYIQGENHYPEALAHEFGIFSDPVQEQSSVLERFRSYRSLSEGEFQEAYEILRSKILSRQLESLQEIWTAFDIFYHLAQRRLINESTHQVRDLFLESISAHAPSTLRQAALDVWPESRDADQDAVLGELRTLETAARTEQQRIRNQGIVRAIIEGDGEVSKELRSMFVQEDPVLIYERLAASGRDGMNRMAKLFGYRLSITNMADYTAEDVPFAEGLAQLIDSKIPAAGRLTLDQAALCELANVLRAFSQAVRKRDQVR